MVSKTLINECLLFNTKWLLFQLYRGKNKYTFLWDDYVHFVLDQQSWILIVLTRWNNNARTHMSLHWAHYSAYEPTSLCLYFLTLYAYINVIVFGLTRSWIEPTTYRTWCEYSNHYTTVAVLLLITTRLVSLEYVGKKENALSIS